MSEADAQSFLETAKRLLAGARERLLTLQSDPANQDANRLGQYEQDARERQAEASRCAQQRDDARQQLRDEEDASRQSEQRLDAARHALECARSQCALDAEAAGSAVALADNPLQTLEPAQLAELPLAQLGSAAAALQEAASARRADIRLLEQRHASVAARQAALHIRQEAQRERQAELEERVSLIETLKRKYGPTLDDILARQETIAARLDNIDNRSEKIAALTAALAESRKELDTLGTKLTASRKKSAPKLAKDIASQLKELGFKQSAFEIALATTREPTLHGFESCDFLFGPNPGEPLLPLRQIGSSGEISRVMLAVKSSLAGQDSTPLMVFDEIDANVGGEIARAVGKKMAILGELHQVIAITHFPQVAATAAAHFVVEKEVVSGRTRSKLYPVVGEKRVNELVRMLGGGGQQARAMAEALLEQG